MRILSVVAAAIFPVAGLSQALVSTTPLGAVPVNPGEAYWVSPDGGHVAIVRKAEGGVRVSVDGVDGEQFDALDDIVNAPASGKLQQPRVVFTNDGKRFAYVARRGSELYVVVDGTKHPGGHDFRFSADGGHFAYVQGDPRGLQPGGAVVLDGKAGPHYDQITDLQITDDGRHTVYSAYGQGVYHAVFDGKPGRDFPKINGLKLARGGPHYAFFVGEREGAQSIFVPVIDGVPQPAAAQDVGIVPNPAVLLSDDGKHWAWIACRAGAGQVFHDGTGGVKHGTIEALELSPDGRRVAYVARTENTRKAMKVLVVDGKQIGGEFYEILGLRFSPDSRRTAAFANGPGGTRVLIDGEALGPFVQNVTDFTFSNRGRYFFIARPTAQKFAAFVDGKLDNDGFDLTRDTVSFSPDGTRLVYSGTIAYPKHATSIDGRMEPFGIENYWGQQTKLSVVWSADSKHLAYNVLEGTSRNVFVDGKPGAEGFLYSMATFSPDSRHFAVAGTKPNSKSHTLFLDGKAVTTLDDVEWRTPATWTFQSDGKLRVLAKKDGQFQRILIDPQSSTLESFTANMSKSGKTPEAKVADKSGEKKKKGGGPTTMAGASPDSGDSPDPEAGAKEKAEAAGAKAKDAVDKGLKKLKGLFGDKKK
jgi:hypothetical protein